MENQFTIGQVLSKSFDIFSKNFIFMLIIGFMVSVPAILLQFALDSAAILVLSFFVIIVMGFLAQGVTVFGVFQHLTNRPVVFSESLSIALGRFFPLLLVSLAVGFLTTIGYFMLIIPGIIIAMMLWVAVPVVIVEQGGVGHALQRSKDLTTGYRGRIFAVVVIMGLISGAANLIQTGILTALSIDGNSTNPVSLLLIQLPVNTICTGLVSALGSVVVTVGYYTLRHEVEGVATEDLASVFE